MLGKSSSISLLDKEAQNTNTLINAHVRLLIYSKLHRRCTAKLKCSDVCCRLTEEDLEMEVI
jgi:hypothetical protein